MTGIYSVHCTANCSSLPLKKMFFLVSFVISKNINNFGKGLDQCLASSTQLSGIEYCCLLSDFAILGDSFQLNVWFLNVSEKNLCSEAGSELEKVLDVDTLNSNKKGNWNWLINMSEESNLQYVPKRFTKYYSVKRVWGTLEPDPPRNCSKPPADHENHPQEWTMSHFIYLLSRWYLLSIRSI